MSAPLGCLPTQLDWCQDLQVIDCMGDVYVGH